MFKNISYNYRTSTIHLWEQFNGKNTYTKEHFVPYIYINTSETTNIKSIDGSFVTKKTFETYGKYKEFITTLNYKPHVKFFENNIKPEIQFLTEHYYKIKDEDIQAPKLKVHIIDIEVKIQDGFPKASIAKESINLLSVYDTKTKRITVFGEHRYNGRLADNVEYIYCKTERNLLLQYLKFTRINTPDVITGWYVRDFDIQYLMRRCESVLKEGAQDLLSPINKSTLYVKNDKLRIDISGITILDYLELYKHFSPNKLESYKLDFVLNHELGHGKLDYSSEADNLKELYEKHWDTFVDYNIRDVVGVYELNKKCGYINLVQFLSLLTKTPMNCNESTTQLIEGAFLTYYRRNQLCAPRLIGGKKQKFKGGYVKEPKKGASYWVSVIDIVSSYPSAIIILNMSLETYLGRIEGVESVILKQINNKKFRPFELTKFDKTTKVDNDRLIKFNTALNNKLISIAPNGVVFNNQKRGILPTVVNYIFNKRIEIKNEMRKVSEIISKTSDVKEEKKILQTEQKKLFSFQYALKIIINAVYGATSVPYSRYFNPDVAKAITSVGRNTNKTGEKIVNEILNDKTKFRDILKRIENGEK